MKYATVIGIAAILAFSACAQEGSITEEVEETQVAPPGPEAGEVPGEEETEVEPEKQEHVGSELLEEEEGEVEIYEYDPSGKGYRSDAEPAPSASDRGKPDHRSMDTYGTRRQDVSLDIPEAPIRPIGKTIVGIILTIEGGVGTGIAVFVMIVAGSSGAPPTVGLPFLGAGLGQLIPGAALLTSARDEWDTYNSWERTYKGRSKAPAVRFEYTWDF